MNRSKKRFRAWLICFAIIGTVIIIMYCYSMKEQKVNEDVGTLICKPVFSWMMKR